tara:strand:+ start:148 stop:765 length:618 start_codon:yes stop_codon:yes gene_type:complete
MSRTLKDAMARLGERAFEPVPEPEPLKDEARNEHIELLKCYMGDIDYALFTDEQIEQIHDTLAQTLKGKARDRWGREQMFINRTRRSRAIRMRKPDPSFVCKMHAYIVSENKRIDALNRKLMTEQDYRNALLEKDGYHLLHPVPYPDAWEAARERALHIEVSALMDEWDVRRRWWKAVSEGRITFGAQKDDYDSAQQSAQSEVME